MEVKYELILATDPCEVFKHFGVEEMHGLTLAECQAYNNTKEDAYIAGLCNVNPHNMKDLFVFINLSRCNNDVETIILLFHEFIHLASNLHAGNWAEKEEEMLLIAETETLKVFNDLKGMFRL